MTTIDSPEAHQPILEEGCIRTGAICKNTHGLFALGDLFHYNGTVIFRHRGWQESPPRDYLNGIFHDWHHDWEASDNYNNVIIAPSSQFQYFGYEGKPI